MRRLLTASLAFAVLSLIWNASSISRVYERTTPSFVRPAASVVLEAAREVESRTNAVNPKHYSHELYDALTQTAVLGDTEAKTFLFVGDSMMERPAQEMSQSLVKQGYSTATKTVKGSLLGSFLWTWEKDIVTEVKNTDADIVVVMLDPEADNKEDFKDAIRVFNNAAISAGASQVVWLVRTWVNDPAYEEARPRIENSLRELDEELSTMVVIDATAVLERSDGSPLRYAQGSSGSRTRLREKDGTHLTQAGAEIFATAVLKEMGL
jgi:hypothetical protein